MRCTNNYEDYLKVTVEDVKRAGFTERYPKYRCGTTYYVKDSCEYVLARTGGNFWVITRDVIISLLEVFLFILKITNIETTIHMYHVLG